MKTVGLAFLEGRIQIVNQGRWRQVSMLERGGTKMPATSNAIESLNGRLNGVTPRLNSFWGSLTRLADISLRRGEAFHRCLIHNFQYEYRKAVKRHAVIATEQMDRELAFVETTDVTCLCGETALTSDMYRIPVPCSHQFALLVRGNPDFPRSHRHSMSIEPPMPELAVPELRWNPGTIDFIFDERIPYCPRDPHIQRDIDHITKKIVKGVHGYRKRAEIEQWVIANYRTSSEFALGETTAFWWMVEMGIDTFRDSHA
jgi:hypothetical protein